MILQMVGGGASPIPATIVAGDTVIYAPVSSWILLLNNTTYTDTGYGIKALKPCTLRIRYTVMRTGSAAISAKLQKNGVDVSGSEITGPTTNTPAHASIDIALSQNDVLRVFAKTAAASSSMVGGFAVSILATDLQGELNNLVIEP